MESPCARNTEPYGYVIHIIVNILLSVLKIQTVKLTGKTLLQRPSCRWEDNIRIYLRQIGVNTRIWIDWAQD